MDNRRERRFESVLLGLLLAVVIALVFFGLLGSVDALDVQPTVPAPVQRALLTFQKYTGITVQAHDFRQVRYRAVPDLSRYCRVKSGHNAGYVVMVNWQTVGMVFAADAIGNVTLCR